MKWYDRLYLGDSVRNPHKIKWKINHNAGTIDIYVIAFASNEKNLLDVIPSWELMQRGYPGKDQMKIIGLAKGREEAFMLVRAIVDEVYQNTGNTDIKAYLKENLKERTPHEHAAAQASEDDRRQASW